MAVDCNCTADRIRYPAEIPLPLCVTDDRYRIPSGQRVVLLKKATPDRRLHLQRRKEISANQSSERDSRLVCRVHRQSRRDILIRDDAAECLTPVHVVLVFGIRKTFQ